MVPFISIQSQRGLIDVKSERGQFEIRRPQPTVTANSKQPEIIAHNRPGNLVIDQKRTNDALTGGKPEAFWQRIYSQYQDIARQNIAQIVQDGNVLGDLRNKSNPIPGMALQEFIDGPPDLTVYGAASLANIDIEYIPNDVNIQVIPGGRNLDVQVHRPEIEFHRGSVSVFVQQYPKVTITPPTINIMA
jgi:hypothetical protein